MTREKLRELAREYMGELVLATRQYADFEKRLVEHIDLEIASDPTLDDNEGSNSAQPGSMSTHVASPADILSQLQFAGCLLKRDGTIVSLNTEFVRQCLFCFHYEPKPGDVLLEHLGESANIVEGLIKGVATNQPLTALDHRSVRGEEMTFELLLSKIETQYSEEFILQSRDITLQIQTELELSRRDDLFRTLIQHSSDVIVTTNDFGEIVFVSPAVFKMTQFDADSIVGKRVHDLVAEEDKAEFGHFFNSIGQHEHENLGVELRFVNAAGKHIFVEIYGSRYTDRDKTGYVFNARDVTDRIITFKALQRSENRYKDLIGNAVDVVYTLNSRGEFITLNQAFTDITGFAAQSWIGRSLVSLVHSEDKDKASRGLRLLSEGRSVPPLHLRVACKSGAFIPMEFRSAPLSGEEISGGSVGIARDITEQLQAQQDLQKALAKERELAQLRDRFVSTVTHEFRTPLAGILSVSELLDRYKHRLDENKRDELFGDIKLRVAEITDLIENFVFQSSVHSLKENFRPLPIDAVPLVKDAMITIASQRDLTPEQLNVQCDAETITVTSEPKILQHIVKHIVNDSIKYSRKELRVTVHLEPMGREGVIITISDRGIGIPDSEIDNVFVPFFRASNTSHIPGTGMGLAIVHDFVKLHGGQIRVHKNEFGGTTFTLVLGSA